MNIPQAPRRHSAKNLLVLLILGALGIAGTIALNLLVPGSQPLEPILLLVVTGFVVLGYTQNVIRGLMSAALLYIASGVAATFYQVTAPYIGAPFSATVDRNILALSFGVLTMVIWVILEALTRASFRDTTLPELGILDKLGGLFIYLIIGVLVASLLFNTIGYGQWGRRAHNEALLRSRFNQVLYLYYATQSFWFPRRPPPIYAYDLDLPREH